MIDINVHSENSQVNILFCILLLTFRHHYVMCKNCMHWKLPTEENPLSIEAYDVRDIKGVRVFTTCM